jgi:sugar phosphate isomerase/epimerase
MATTRTGSFPIGFRRGWGQWQRDLPTLVRFAKENDFRFLDFGPAPVEELRQALALGIAIGSVDLMRWSDLVSPDADKRADAVRANAEYVRQVASLGVKHFLAVMTPEDPTIERRSNFGLAADAYRRLCDAVAPLGVKIVLEGWPGKPPHFAALGCTPADLRAMFDAVGSEVLGVNFDPSHLVRMGIEPVRFVHEFAPRIFHAHAKDLAWIDGERYEHGTLQQATFTEPRAFGGHHWRYALPGRGACPWKEILAALHEQRYRGLLSIELEDAHLNGATDREQRGLIEARVFLAGT